MTVEASPSQGDLKEPLGLNCLDSKPQLSFGNEAPYPQSLPMTSQEYLFSEIQGFNTSGLFITESSVASQSGVPVG